DKQSVDSQLSILREYATKRELNIIAEFIDRGISGAKDNRPQLNKMMNLVRKRKIDIVLVFRFDRFARSTKHLITALDEFQTLGVDFISYSENIDTSTPIGKVLFTIIAAFSSFEREIIIERVKNGLDTAKRKGKVLGRPSLSNDIKNKIIELRNNKLSMSTISNKLNVSKGFVHKTLKNSTVEVAEKIATKVYKKNIKRKSLNI
ncbi:unnamed protein product, partial [marine sediment metagenome]